MAAPLVPWRSAADELAHALEDTEPDEPDWGPALWQVELVLLFDDAPELLPLDGGTTSDTGFSFEPPGRRREAVLNEIGEHEQVKAAISAVPVASSIQFGATDQMESLPGCGPSSQAELTLGMARTAPGGAAVDAPFAATGAPDGSMWSASQFR